MGSEGNPYESRRGMVATVLMLVGVAAGYGLGLVHFFRYLVPLRRQGQRREMFVGTLADIPVGTTLTVKDPQGHEVNILRTAENADHPERGFKALSSTCPHLGCQVRWEAANDRFFCPCHAGVFDKEGIAREGPPAQEGKNLATYEVRVNSKSGWVFIMVRPESGHAV